MKTIFIASLVVIAGLISFESLSQQPKQQKIKAGYGVPVMQTQPQFPGGEDSLAFFLKRNIHQPQRAQNSGEGSRVLVAFVVDKTGKIKDTRIAASASAELDAEVLRVIQMMPAWKPGTAGGNPIDIQFLMPVVFVFQNSK